MPNYCVVGGCKNVTNKSIGISTHAFPKDRKIRSKWVQFVQRSRVKKFKDPAPNNVSSVICSVHFTQDCFEDIPNLSCQMESGYHRNRSLKMKPDAVPTLVLPAEKKDSSSSETPKKTKAGAWEKRERKRIIEEAMSTVDSLEPAPPACPDDLEEHDEVITHEEAQEKVDDVAIGLPSPPSIASESAAANYGRVNRLSRSKIVLVSITPVKRKNQAVQCKRKEMKVHRRSKHTQCDIGTNSFQLMSPTPQVPVPSNPVAASTPRAKKRKIAECLSEEENDDIPTEPSVTFCEYDSENKDPTWKPDLSAVGSEHSILSDHEEESGAMTKPTMYAVEKKSLLHLFKICHKCGYLGAEGRISSSDGTAITVTQYCLQCEEEWRWTSQEMIGKFASGNIGLSCAILAAGAIPSKTLKVLRFWGLQAIKCQTYFSHQRNFLNQAVRNTWENESIRSLANLGDVARLSGDARCDSVGHCAKYGSYSLHDTDSNAIVITELVQSTEVKNSYHMELEGLTRGLDYIEAALPHLKIELTTDGHVSVAKWLREEKNETVTHFFDIWHVAKGLRKKLTNLAKKFTLVKLWIKSIINHLYWCAVTSNNNGALMVAKWKSVANHIADIHQHEDELFPCCVHGPISPKQWFDKGSEEYDRITLILLNKTLLKSVSKLSSNGQTSGLEGFHSTLLHFAPKMYHFGYNGMKSRLEMAALHFNENAGREQSRTKNGTLQFYLRNPKNRYGETIVVPVKKSQTFGYVDNFITEVRRLVLTGKKHGISRKDDPPPLCSKYKRPRKEQAVAQRRAFFRHKRN